MHNYEAQVKINGKWIKTIIHAENKIHARLIAQYQFGFNNVLSTLNKVS